MHVPKLRIGHYQSILFCTDFSENADVAFDFAVDAAIRNTGCTLHLLHVIPEPDAQFWKGYIYEVEDVDAKARADIDRKIDAAYRARVPEGVPFTVDIRIGSAARTILDVADAMSADLIILGRQGHGAFSHWLLGNVSGKIAQKARCPVLIVPASRERTGEHPESNKKETSK